MAMDDGELAFGRSLAAFMSACTPIEQHLLDGPPVIDTNLELISTTVTGLHSAILVWKRKNGLPLDLPPRSASEG